MNRPEFKPGSFVKCSSFKGEAQVLEGPNSKGEYRLALGNLNLWVAAATLTELEKTSKRPSSNSQKIRNALLSDKPSGDRITIDLHGKKVPEALDELERAIDRAVLNDIPLIEVIHGLGSGILKHAVTKYLSESKHVSKFKLDDNNPGLTLVYI